MCKWFIEFDSSLLHLGQKWIADAKSEENFGLSALVETGAGPLCLALLGKVSLLGGWGPLDQLLGRPHPACSGTKGRTAE